MNSSIKVIPFPGIENAYIVISAHTKSNTNEIIQMNVKHMISFFYGTPKGGAEWEPDYGPVSVVIPCDKDFVSEGYDGVAVSHWFYPKHGLNWSQLAVEDNHLPEKFLNGDYEGIFGVLKSWVREEK